MNITAANWKRIEQASLDSMVHLSIIADIVESKSLDSKAHTKLCLHTLRLIRANVRLSSALDAANKKGQNA